MAASPAELAATCELCIGSLPPWSCTCGRCDCQPFTCRKRHASMPLSARAFLQCYCEASPGRDTRVISHDRRVEKLSPAPLSGAAGSFLQPWVSVRRRVVPGEKLTFISAALPTSSTRDKLRRAFDLWERANAGRTSEIEVLALTDSFQYGIDSDRFGLDPFQIRRSVFQRI